MDCRASDRCRRLLPCACAIHPLILDIAVRDNLALTSMYEKRYPAVEAEGLRKHFGATEALHGLDLTVPAGTVYRLLGPNGAGKPVTGLWLSFP